MFLRDFGAEYKCTDLLTYLLTYALETFVTMRYINLHLPLPLPLPLLTSIRNTGLELEVGRYGMQALPLGNQHD